MWKGFAHQAFGFAAAGMVVAALFYFVSPYAEGAVGPERLGTFQIVVVALFAVYGIRLLAGFIGMLMRKN